MPLAFVAKTNFKQQPTAGNGRGFFIGPGTVPGQNKDIVMSNKSQTAETRKAGPSAEQRGELGPRARGSDILIQALEREGVECIFAYPGGASMEFHQSLTRSKIRTILPRHEQGGAFAAEGYARATGKAGVCMATSGPGATNLITGLADAYMDSIPVVSITGQVPQAMIGKGAFQETDFFGLTLPVVKHSYLITDINDIPRVIKEAFYVATSGRPGPVVVDVPKNIQQAEAQPFWPREVNLRGYDPVKRADDVVLNEIIGLIEKAERPLLYVGGGIISSGAADELRKFAEAARIPVTTTIMGCGAFPEQDELALKFLGMHGTAYANWAVNGDPKNGIPGADLLLAFGVRFDDRVTGKVDKFAEQGTIVHLDIDASEINKNKPAHLPIVADVKDALERLNQMIQERPIRKKFTAWHQQISEWKAKAPLRYRITDEVLKSQHVKDFMDGDASQVILPQYAIELLYELTQGEAIITTGVGQHQMWAAQYYQYKFPRQFLTSAGLGAMGYGYPAALGAKVGHPERQVVDIDGDGSFLMNIQELATAHIEKIAAKAIILNNQHLGMVVQWEDRFYAGNRGNTYLGDPENMKQIYPDYVTMAKSFNVPCERVIYKKDLRAAMQRMLDSDQPYLLDVITPYSEHVLPFIPAGRTVQEMIYQE
jgi:acetolactate synthase-1/2/3 large subunit